jgi:orotidine-5'-phosphate decarboxylase
MTRKELVDQIYSRKTYLCVGLDTDISKIPKHLLNEEDPVFAFNKAIIDSTQDHCVAYKINTAFYEAIGVNGWMTLEKTVNYIPDTHFKIADAKRGDIGNTSEQYARAFFQTLPFDSITVAPYMGSDSVQPFLQYSGKWAIVLGLTSNKGSADFEMQQLISSNGETHLRPPYLYERVLSTVMQWGTTENLMFVVGATQAEEFVNIRNIIPDHFLLVPGVGAQGGSLKDISEKAMNQDCGLLINASRSIIYASSGEDFAEKAADEAKAMHEEMKGYLRRVESL